MTASGVVDLRSVDGSRTLTLPDGFTVSVGPWGGGSVMDPNDASCQAVIEYPGRVVLYEPDGIVAYLQPNGVFVRTSPSGIVQQTQTTGARAPTAVWT